jgi:hypothetical protein
LSLRISILRIHEEEMETTEEYGRKDTNRSLCFCTYFFAVLITVLVCSHYLMACPLLRVKVKMIVIVCRTMIAYRLH